jgi:hypothetical protein
MAFLFKSKKNQGPQGNPQAQAQRDLQNTVAPQPTIPSANGKAAREEKTGQPQLSTPSSSVNNSVQSLGGSVNTPSPEQQNMRRAQGVDSSQDLTVRTHMRHRESLRLAREQMCLRPMLMKSFRCAMALHRLRP